MSTSSSSAQVIVFNGKKHVAYAVKSKNGMKGARLPNGLVVPWGICGCAAGKDAWMRDIEFKCNGCGVSTKASDLYADCLCEVCYDKLDVEG